MRRTKVWMNGRLLDGACAGISVYDRGFLYGDGIFETVRSYGGTPFQLKEHLSRLFDSAKAIEIKIAHSKEALEEAVRRVLKANGLCDASVRITVTRGAGAFAMTKQKECRPNVVITAKKFTGYPKSFYTRGISAHISDIRQDEDSPLSRIKTMNFLNHIVARLRAGAAGFDEAILVNRSGRVAEAATSNIFLVKNGKLLTPSLDDGILPGITRKAVIRQAGKLKITVTERHVLRKELTLADELFLTSSLAEILPVVRIGRARIGSGRPGRITKLLHVAYRNRV